MYFIEAVMYFTKAIIEGGGGAAPPQTPRFYGVVFHRGGNMNFIEEMI